MRHGLLVLHKVPTRAATHMSSASTCRTLMDMENDLVFTLCAQESILWRTDSFVCMQAIGRFALSLGPEMPGSRLHITWQPSARRGRAVHPANWA
jgi:hypothetical protein